MNRRQARKRFAKWVEAVGGQSAAARKLNCSKAMVCLMVAGKRSAGVILGPVIEEHVGIPPRAWQTTEVAA